jgi:hypothetical protein
MLDRTRKSVLPEMAANQLGIDPKGPFKLAFIRSHPDATDDQEWNQELGVFGYVKDESIAAIALKASTIELARAEVRPHVAEQLESKVVEGYWILDFRNQPADMVILHGGAAHGEALNEMAEDLLNLALNFEDKSLVALRILKKRKPRRRDIETVFKPWCRLLGSMMALPEDAKDKVLNFLEERGKVPADAGLTIAEAVDVDALIREMAGEKPVLQ